MEVPGQASLSTYTAPVCGDDNEPSDVPALFGLKSLSRLRTVIDLVNGVIHFCGPGDVIINTPAGTVSAQMEAAPSSHMLIPCTNYNNTSKQGTSLNFQMDHAAMPSE